MRFRQIVMLVFGLAALIGSVLLWRDRGGLAAIVIGLCGLALVITATLQIVLALILKTEGRDEDTGFEKNASSETDDTDARLRAKIAALADRARLSEQDRPRASVEPESPAPPPASDAEQQPVPQSGPIAFETLLSEFARPALALLRPYPPVRLASVRSHVGGLPDLPSDIAWPRAFDDTGCVPANAPLHFLAQIDLAEQPWLPSDFPRSGTVMFFGALTDGYFWDTENDARVIYDPNSCGTPTLPPEDIEGIDGGYGDYQRIFGDDDWLRCRIFPQWPIMGKRIDTMPDGDAFVLNSYHNEKYLGYHEALNDFRAEQAALAAGIDLSDDTRFVARPAVSLLEEPGFPWTARYVALWGRMVRQKCPDELKDSVSQLVEWADSCEASAPIAADKAADFRAMLNSWPRSDGALPPGVDSASPVLRRLIREAGGDMKLAELLPEALYAYVELEHLPVKVKGDFNRRDKKLTWNVRHHQVGGHVPSTQEPVPLDSDRVCLAQFQSDYGTEMILCDLGEADFWIEPARLANADFSDVLADTRGG